MEQMPSQLGFRMPAEWEPHIHTYMGWPERESTWPGKLEHIPEVFITIVQALNQFEPVYICANSQQSQQARYRLQKIRATRVQFLEDIPTNDVWLRDFGPIPLTHRRKEEIDIAIVNWNYNSLGGKYPPYDLDDAVPKKIAQFLGNVRIFEPGIVLEGGSIEVNGRGTLITTESCLLNKNRNPHLDKMEIETYLKLYLGVTNILWLGEGIVGDDTDGHIDDLARFINPNTVLCALEEDPADPNYTILQDAYRRLSRMKDERGNPLVVIPLYMPSPIEYQGQRLPASYANFYIANGVVLVPTYCCANDARALETLTKCFPSRKIIGIDCTDLVWGLGAIHCVTMQQAAYL